MAPFPGPGTLDGRPSVSCPAAPTTMLLDGDPIDRLELPHIPGWVDPR